MGFLLYPAYPSPIHDIKLNELWQKCFDINGRIHGFEITAGLTLIELTAGAFFSNGCVVKVDAMSLSLSNVPDEPYYLYGYFGAEDSDHLGVVGFSKGLEAGYAHIATRKNGQWTLADAIHFEDLKQKIAVHTPDADIHITSAEYDGLQNANSPCQKNVFAKESDLLLPAVITKNELALLPHSMACTPAIDVNFPQGVDYTVLSDSLSMGNVGFVPNGINDTINLTTTTARRGLSKYIEDILKSPIAPVTSANTSWGRVSAEFTTDFSAPNDSTSLKFNITNGSNKAHVTWFWLLGQDIGSATGRVYMNYFVPDDDKLEYIELDIFDGTSNAIVRKRYSQLFVDEWDAISVDVSNLNKSTIKNITLFFRYEDGSASGDYYVGAPYVASVVKTDIIKSLGSEATSLRASPLEYSPYSFENISIDATLDTSGTVVVSNVLADENIDLSAYSPVSNPALSLTFHLVNSGGNYSQTKTSWPDARKDFMMFNGGDSGIAIMLGGIWESMHETSSIVYRRASDAYVTGMANLAVSLHSSANASIGNKLYINGGKLVNTPVPTNLELNWANQTIRSLINMPTSKYNHGCISDENKRLMVWQGVGTNSVYEYLTAADSWVTLSNSAHSGQTIGRLVDNAIYAGRGSAIGGTGAKYLRNSKVWSALSLNNFTSYSTCALLKSRAIIYESELGTDVRRSYFDPDRLVEKAIQCPLTGAGNSGTSVYSDDAVSFGPYEKSGIYYTSHSIYIPHKLSALGGYCMKYRT